MIMSALSVRRFAGVGVRAIFRDAAAVSVKTKSNVVVGRRYICQTFQASFPIKVVEVCCGAIFARVYVVIYFLSIRLT